MKIGVSTLSGGMDSTTVTTMAAKECDALIALTFYYGQRHAKEIYHATSIADRIKSQVDCELSHQIINVSDLRKLAEYSSLTNLSEEVPTGRSEEEMGKGVPITYVPGRNTVFTSLAASAIDSLGLKYIREMGRKITSASIYVGANALDYSGYPDCRPDFYSAMEKTMELGLALCTEEKIPVKIKAPIIQLSKAGIVKTALNVNAPLDLTWSCYKGEDFPCKECDSCLLRAKGFEEAGITDPALLAV